MEFHPQLPLIEDPNQGQLFDPLDEAQHPHNAYDESSGDYPPQDTMIEE